MMILMPLACVLVLTSCSAVCLRDSDCIGESVCVRDRCVLVGTSTDAGALPTASLPAASLPPDVVSNRDANSAPVGTDVGSAATPTRGILDAASDAPPLPPAL